MFFIEIGRHEMPVNKLNIVEVPDVSHWLHSHTNYSK